MSVSQISFFCRGARAHSLHKTTIGGLFSGGVPNSMMIMNSFYSDPHSSTSQQFIADFKLQINTQFT